MLPQKRLQQSVLLHLQMMESCRGGGGVSQQPMSDVGPWPDLPWKMPTYCLATYCPATYCPSIRGGELSDLQVTISEEGRELLVTVSASPTVLD